MPTRRPIAEQLGDDRDLGRLVAKAPGLRLPGTVDGFEIATRAVLGQQVSLAAARTLAGRLVAAHGTPLAVPDGGLTHLFPEPDDIADSSLDSLGMPAARRAVLRAVAASVANGEVVIDAGAEPCRDGDRTPRHPRSRAVDGVVRHDARPR